MGFVVLELSVTIFLAGGWRLFEWESRFEVNSPLPAATVLYRCRREITITLGRTPLITFLPGPTPELPVTLDDDDEEDLESGHILDILDPPDLLERRAAAEEWLQPRVNLRASSRSRSNSRR